MRHIPRIRLDRRIPAPPFADAEASAAFHRSLAIHLAELGRASGGPHPETLAVCALVSAGRADASTLPTPLVLATALRTFFPAGWTPVSVVEAARELLPSQDRHWSVVREDRLAYDGDPRWSARRDSAGRWSAEWNERGAASPDVTAEDDDEMVLHLMAHLTDPFPYPYAWSGTDEESARRRADAAEVARVFALERRLPYLASWAEAEPGAEHG
ncbi:MULTISPECIES: hypothetical protein [unclassified Rathayibacter]|uniref:hypothetical protein n=1 Tax=unclassified Rathayibacter TaxID=2609250 RepID=UPI000F4B74BF|nr:MULTISPECIES: hypothetical protein [unclassified Rathayibacter]ROP43413.1 hypothetical protein EDF45_4161 [Rathayibacter sp. PhB186]ROS46569.1 hypothetical protein EDF44_4145 [Rathayibacter sp. PhB185]